ncbi:MAG: hypothetical protein QOE77_1004 [Blastocatellia bacterium]|jgi:hypothetical protein|nr:hypothetical protein [Blastocatellia bacterium]
MTEDEYEQLNAMLNRLTDHEKRLRECARDPDDDFTPVMNGIIELLVSAQKRISDRMGGQ